MNIKNNVSAFEHLTKIEIGIREFLIVIIKENGIKNWFNDFLGSIQRESLNDISKRINDAYVNHISPRIEDQYIFKANKAVKTINQSFKTSNLCHPFYYLNWSDMENLIRNKTNTILIDNKIGKLNREVLTENLKNLNFLRNDIAHARIISESDFLIINGSYKQIFGLVPNFKTLIENQTFEENFDFVVNRIYQYVLEIEESELLSNDELGEIIHFLNNCENSFWLNTLNKDLVEVITQFYKIMVAYEINRKKPGGLLEIHKLKVNNEDLFSKIKELTNYGKV
ncbi:MAG: hypothetical protein AB9846_00515 [Tenuifilaceae bacterium]